MIARPITSPDEAPSACSVRHTISMPIEVEKIAATLAVAVMNRPVSSTGLRPKRSDSGPSSSCDTARPEQIERQRELHRLDLGVEQHRQARRRRHQDVERDRPDRAHRHQQHDQAEAAPGGLAEFGRLETLGVGASTGTRNVQESGRVAARSQVAVSLSTSGPIVSATRAW